MTATIPSDTHAVGDAGHTTDHNDIADVLALCAKALAELAGTTSSTNATNITAIQAQVAAGYAALLGMVNPMTTEGDLITGGASGAAQRLGAGTSGYFLKSQGPGSLLVWAAGGGEAGGAPTAWYNAVSTYSADNTGDSDCYSDVNTMLTAAGDVDGPVVCYFPAGTYSTSQGWSVPPNVIILGDFIAGSATVGALTGTVFEPRSTFTGSYVFYVPDVGHAITSGPVIRHIGINGSSHTASSVDGIQLYGPVLSATVEDVRIIEMSGWGMNYLEDTTAAETTEGFPFGGNYRHIYIDTCGQGGSAGGINLYYNSDSIWDDVYVIGCEGPGWVVTACDNCHFINCRSEWNSEYGVRITGDWSYASGVCQFTNFSTDRNTYDGIYIDATWTADGDGTGPCVIQFANLACRRDGSAGGTTYAGLRVNATSLPVAVAGISVTVDDNDGGGGNMTPYYGVYAEATGTTPVMISGPGIIWGENTAYGHSGTVTNVQLHAYFPATGPSYTPAYGSYVT